MQDKKFISKQVSALKIIDKRLSKLIDGLLRNRKILTVICSDHRESFGEEFLGFQRCGHLHLIQEVLNVPLMISVI